MKNIGVRLENARHPKQREIMLESANRGVCPFCLSELNKKPDGKGVLKRNSSWVIKENGYPYEGSSLHLLLIPKRHVCSPTELHKKETEDLFKLICWATKKFNIKGAGLAMRFGDTEMTGGSIDHLHVHIISGIKKTKRSKALTFKLGYRKQTPSHSTE